MHLAIDILLGSNFAVTSHSRSIMKRLVMEEMIRETLSKENVINFDKMICHLTPSARNNLFPSGVIKVLTKIDTWESGYFWMSINKTV